MGFFGVSKLQTKLFAVLASVLVTVVGPALPALAAMPVNSVAPSITGTATVGSTVTRNLGTWTATPAATMTQAWYSCTSRVTAAVSAKPAACTAIAGATAATYVVPAAQAAKFISVAVSAKNTTGTLTRWSVSTAAISTGPTGAAVPVNSTPPSITGTARVGGALTGAIGTWTSTPVATVTQQWYSCTATVAAATATQPSTCTSIPNATTTSYTPVAGDVARFLSFAVTQTNTSGAVTMWSISTASITSIPLNTVAPVVTSTGLIGAVSTASTGTWSATPAATYTYAWHRCTTRVTVASATIPTGCTAITGATAASYTLVAADAGLFVDVKVTATNSAGAGTMWSISTAGVGSIPTNSVAPTVTGTASVGSTLTGAIGTWAATPAATVTQNWYQCTAAVTAAVSAKPAACTSIPTALATTYVAVAGDAGKFLSFAVTETNISGSLTRWSISTAALTQVPSNTIAPTISGTGLIGAVETASTGTWLGSPAPTYAYSWHRCTSRITATSLTIPAGCTAITGATAAIYTLVAADAGLYVDVKVTATNSAGTATIWTLSTGGVGTLPTNTVVPSISGTASVGSTLTGSIGTWTSAPAATVTQQWHSCTAAVTVATSTLPAGCTAVSGATATTFATTNADAGKFFSFAVTQSNIVGTVTIWSASTGATQAPPLNTVAPTFSGNPTVGGVLTGYVGTWIASPVATVTQNWYSCTTPITAISSTKPASCTLISGATSLGYTIVTADAGKYLSLAVTETNSLGSSTVWSKSQLLNIASFAKNIQSDRACLVTNFGELFCWSFVSRQVIPKAIFTEGVKQVALDGQGFGGCVLMTNGTVSCGDLVSWAQLPNLANAITVSVSYGTGCAVTQIGEIWCWGQGGSGQLGNGTFADSALPVKVSGLTNATSVSVGMYHVCATVTDGSVKCWGEGGSGQLGYGGFGRSAVPITVAGLTGAKFVASGERESCAGSSAGLLSCWGANERGQIGNATSGPTEPLPLNLPSLGSVYSVSIGQAWLGGSGAPRVCATNVTGAVYCWGNLYDYSSGMTLGQLSPTTLTSVTSAKQIIVGAATLLLDGQGRITILGVLSTQGYVTQTPVPLDFPISDVPVTTSPPVISGASGASVGSLLSSTSGTYLGVDPGTGFGTPTWYRCQTVVPAGSLQLPQDCALVSNATDYTLQAVDVGNRLVVVYRVVNDLGFIDVSSASTEVIASRAFPLSSPYIVGTGTVGLSLSGQVGVWSGAPDQPVFTRVNWYKCSSPVTSTPRQPIACIAIQGANSIFYTPVMADYNQYLSFAVTETNSLGESTWWSDSLYISGWPVRNLRLPDISVPVNVWKGVSGYLGTWSGTPDNPTLISVAWYVCDSAQYWNSGADCTVISGATGLNYLPTASYRGKYISFAVTEANSMASLTAWSQTRVLISGTPAWAVTSPSITGLGVVGQTVSGSVGVWDGAPEAPVVTSTYWYLCDYNAGGTSVLPPTCVVILGATGTDFTPDSSMAGKWLSFNVNVTNSSGAASSWSWAVLLRPKAISAHGRCALLEDSTLKCYGVGTLSNIASLMAQAPCAKATNGDLVCWANGRYFTAVKSVKSFSDEKDAYCGISETAEVYCWGSNEYGQLGNGSWNLGAAGTKVSSLNGVTKVVTQIHSACALTALGQVFCWGAGNSGQLGNGAIQDSNVPVLVQGVGDAVSIFAVGPESFCAQVASGEIYCWGKNNVGQLGNGSFINGSVPSVVVGLNDVVSVSSLGDSACATVLNGDIYCWGGNAFGRLGVGDQGNINVASIVPGFSGVVRYYPSYYHVCALMSDKKVKCSGLEESGRLGNGSVNWAVSPFMTDVAGLENVMEVVTSDATSCALKNDDTVWCWGPNASGQVGNGTNIAVAQPVLVQGIGEIARLYSTGYASFCAQSFDGETWCWGYGGDGLFETWSGGSTRDHYSATNVGKFLSFEATGNWPQYVRLTPEGLAVLFNSGWNYVIN